MNEAHILSSNKDSILVAIPFLFMLFLSVFRIDHLLATPTKTINRNRRPACGVDDTGEPILCDPDGKRFSIVGRQKMFGPSATRQTAEQHDSAQSG
jgi:hypothetical protein